MEVSLELYYSRFGVLVRPQLPKIGFDYNRVYNSMEDVVRDFALHGWSLINVETMLLSNTLGNKLFTFRKG